MRIFPLSIVVHILLSKGHEGDFSRLSKKKTLDHSNSPIGIKDEKGRLSCFLLWDPSSRDFLLLNLPSARMATESFLLGVLWGASIAAQAIIRDIDESSQ